MGSQAFLAETVETENKNRCVTEAMHILRSLCTAAPPLKKIGKTREESLGKINKCDLEIFRNGSVHEFYRLKELITLEQVNTSVVKKKKKEQSSLAKANWSGVVNFSCSQMSLVMSMLFTLYFQQ